MSSTGRLPSAVRRLGTAALVLVATAVAGPLALAQPRALHWDELAVEARLDAEGRLHVVERQTMVFTGDWNGGERRFDLRPGQRIELDRIVRVDPATGEERELVQGSVEIVDGWDWFDGDTVRWRARAVTDPPFDATAITYRLEYALSNVLQPGEGDDRYVLDHEFAFADRDGPIERFTVDLAVDPVWRAAWPVEVVMHDLRPGESPVTRVELVYTGDGEPASVIHPPHPLAAVAPFVLVAAAMGWLWWRFWRAERGPGRHARRKEVDAGSGRYDRLPDVERRPDRGWLDEHVLSRVAEEVGAVWDRSVGQAEVSALLARFVAEGRMRSHTEEVGRKKVLHLELAVPRDEFRGYELDLIRKLFFGKATKTDTERVRKHYKSKGFDPASVIRPDLAKVLPKGELPPDVAVPWRRWLTPALLAAAALVSFAAIWLDPMPALVVFPAVLFSAPLFVAGLIYALVWRSHVSWPAWTAWLLPLPGALALAGTALATLGIWWFAAVPTGMLGLLGAALTPLAVGSAHLFRARTREPRSSVHLRRRLAHARAHFAGELGRDTPDLEDAWYPYLLALGLGGKVQSWATRAGGRVGSSAAWSGGTSSGGSSPSPGGWTGGGGAFGGAGATAAWSAAAAGMAAGVAAPSSSGGGSGGGGGGGGSSGGGGGGGW